MRRLVAKAKEYGDVDSFEICGECNQKHGGLNGLVGYGKIARRVVKMMSGFDMKVIHCDPFLPDSTDLDTLLAESDYVSVHRARKDKAGQFYSNEIKAARAAGEKSSSFELESESGRGDFDARFSLFARQRQQNRRRATSSSSARCSPLALSETGVV